MSAVDAIEFTEKGSFTAELESTRYSESGGSFGADIGGLEISEGYDPTFRAEAPEMGIIEAIADRMMGSTANQFQIDPETLGKQVVEAPALAAGAIAAAAQESKVVGNINFGQKFDVSQKADSTKFFKGQQQAEQTNGTKLDQTTTSVEVLAGAHQKLAGAEMEMRANVMGGPSGDSGSANTQSAMNADDPVNKASGAGGLVKSMLLGSAATTAAAFLAPGAAPMVKAAAAVGTANAAGNMFGAGNSQNYDKPRSKAEAREMRDPASAMNSSPDSTNYFDNTTAGGMIMPPSDTNKSFNQAANNQPSSPEPSDPRMAQIAELEKAKGEIWKEGVIQTSQMEDAEVAASSHEDWRESGVSRYGLNEVIRAAEADTLSGGDDLLAVVRKTENTTELSRVLEGNKIPELNPENMTFAPSFGGGMK